MKSLIFTALVLFLIAPTNGDAQINEATCAPRDHPCTISRLSTKIVQNPGDLELYLLRAIELRKKGDHNAAILDFSIYIDKNADQPLSRARGLFERAECFKENNQIDEALKDNEEAVKLVPNNATYLASRGETHSSKREYKLAMADLDAALKMDPNNSSALVARGWTYTWLFDDKRAFADYNKAISVDPINAGLITTGRFVISDDWN